MAYRMKSKSFLLRSSTVPLLLLGAATALAVFPGARAIAQQPAPVPADFQSTYNELDNYLTNFNVTLNSRSAGNTATLMAGSLMAANSNAGPKLLNAGNAIHLQINALKAMGVRAIMVQAGFPVLYEPFLASQGQPYSAWLSFYTGLAAYIRQAGLKLIVENDTLLSDSAGGGWKMASFYSTLSWTEYQQARAQTAAVIAQTMQPDYMVVLEEPDTEANNSGQANVNTASGATAMLTQILASVQQAGVPNLKVGAGVGSWLPGYLGFVQGFLTLPVDFIDFHIYPINWNMLPNALQIVDAAAAAGKPVAMSEFWLSKEADNEVGKLSSDLKRARDAFNFWAPLDAYFIQSMQHLASTSQMLFLNPFNANCYFAYQPYDSATESLTPAQILSQESSLTATANQQAQFTSTALSYYHANVMPADTTRPLPPAGLQINTTKTATTLTWSASTDNIGVAGYNVLRDGALLGTTANLSYKDTGYSPGAGYTYSVEAFDLAGNISAPSQPGSTSEVTPSLGPPSQLAATAISSQKVNLAWSAPANSQVANYLVFWGFSPSLLTWELSTGSAATTYTVPSLTAGTSYYFGVKAVDQSGNLSSMSAIVQAGTPAPPSAPTNLSLTQNASGIVLAWSPAASHGLPVQSYHVYRGAQSSGLTQVAIVEQTSFRDSDVKPGTRYYYSVAAADTAADLSSMSATVTVGAPSPVAPAVGAIH